MQNSIPLAESKRNLNTSTPATWLERVLDGRAPEERKQLNLVLREGQEPGSRVLIP